MSTAKDPVAVAETSPSHFYMIVDGLKGDAKEQGHASWFEIDSFDVAGTSTGDRTRVTSFGPLSVDVSSDAALTEMLIEGIKTNIPLQRRIMTDTNFRKGGTDIHYLEKKLGIQ